MDDSSKMSHNTSLRALVIDVQGNPGGPLQSGLELASMFLPKYSSLLKMTTHNKTETYRSLNNHYIPERKLSLLVLTDQNTASASEVFTTALMDNHRTIVAGAKTLGKNLAQALVRLSDQSAISLTVALFKGPHGKDLGYGILPHLPSKSSIFVSVESLSRKERMNSKRSYIQRMNSSVTTENLSGLRIDYHEDNMNSPCVKIENIRYSDKNKSWAVVL